MPLNARTYLLATALIIGAAALVACGDSSPTRTVPAAATLGGAASAVAGATTGASAGANQKGGGAESDGPSLLHAGSAAAIHAAANCIRTHGVPTFPDPVVDAGGHAYSDTRSIEHATDAARQAIDHACSALLATAGVDPTRQPPAPPALVQAGVAAARCARAHGMPNRRDPNAESSWTPGHGFGMTASEVPAGGKRSAGFQEAGTACRAEWEAEMRASTLSSLGGG